MKIVFLYTLVLVHFSDWDGRLLQSHKIAAFPTKEECVAAKKEMRTTSTMKAICTKYPQDDYKDIR